MDICIIQVENIQHFLLTSKPFPKWFNLYLIPIKFYNSSSHLIENTWYFQTVKFLPSGSCKKDLIGIICNSRIPIKISIFPLKKKKKRMMSPVWGEAIWDKGSEATGNQHLFSGHVMGFYPLYISNPNPEPGVAAREPQVSNAPIPAPSSGHPL